MDVTFVRGVKCCYLKELAAFAGPEMRQAGGTDADGDSHLDR